MSDTWGRAFTVTIFGESHGKAVGCVLGGLPAGFVIDFDGVRGELARRSPATWEGLATRRREEDAFEVLSGVLPDGRTCAGTPLCALTWNRDARPQDYAAAGAGGASSGAGCASASAGAGAAGAKGDADGAGNAAGIATGSAAGNAVTPRPGHADWAALQKYGVSAELHGGAHFSGRLTAPLVFAGAVARQLLAERAGIRIGARALQIGAVRDAAAPPTREGAEAVIAASRLPFPALCAGVAADMRQEILNAQAAGDSVGGLVECAASGIPGGWGDPFFRPLEGALSSLLFCIPAVKGVEFGAGFSFANARGSQANDALRYAPDGDSPAGDDCSNTGTADSPDSDRAAGSPPADSPTAGPLHLSGVRADTNHAGGVNGGITNGEPLLLRAAFRPTPTIAKPQTTVNLATRQTVTAAFGGRHDPCIVLRAIPAVEACVTICLLDYYLWRSI